MADVRRGMPDRERVLRLLNAAYGGWGTEVDLRWAYDEYPGFDADRHTFYVERDGSLAAFRRVFAKQLSVGDRTLPAFVLGDTAVGPDHRGQGLYSDLHARTVEFCRSADARRVLTFNRTNNVTFAANRERGWRYHTLPLYVLVRSPARVLPAYADRALAGESLLTRAFGVVGDSVGLSVDGEPVPLSTLGGGEPAAGDRRRLDVPVPPPVVDRLVSAASKRERRRALSALVRPTAVEPGVPPSSSRGDPAVRSLPDPTDVDVERLHSLAAAAAADAPVSFRRDERDVRHLLGFPHDVRVLIVERDGEPRGYAVVGARVNGAVTEARVLDVGAEDATEFLALVDAIERVADENGYDLTVLCSRTSPGGAWIPIDKQVVMWNDPDDRGDSLDLRDEWRIGFYDVE